MRHVSPAPYISMKTIQFSETDELLDIRYDHVFKAVFAGNSRASRGALSDLISALISRTVTVETITANEPPVDDIHNRQIRFDISCKTETGELVNIEMSLDPDPYEPVRLEYYEAKLFTGQNIKGVGKNYSDLKEAYQITLLGKGLFFDDDALVHSFKYYDPVHGVPLRGKTQIITVELPKAELVLEKPAGEMEAQEAWAVFIQYLTNREKRGKINEILEHEEGIAMAGEVLIHITQHERDQARKLSELKYILDNQSKLVTAERKGRKEGFAEGKIEANIENARKMKTMGFSAGQIQDVTGLSINDI